MVQYYLNGLTNTVCILSRQARNTPLELICDLLKCAGLRPDGTVQEELRERFCAYLSDRYWLGKNVVLVIDDAEKLTSAVWQELYRIGTTTFDDGQTQPQLIVVGRPQAFEFLKTPTAAGWNEMDYKVHQLPALTRPDVSLYISDQLRAAGLSERVFSPKARDTIGKLCGGSIGLANKLSRVSLALAQRRSSTMVDQELVRIAYSWMTTGQVIAAARELVSAKDTSDVGELFVSRDGKLLGRRKLDSPLFLGRSTRNQIRLESPEVSRNHAVISLHNNRYVIEDLGSSNGLTVNGELAQKRDLNDLDVISIGPFQIAFAAPLSDSRQLVRRSPRRAPDDRSTEHSARSKAR